MAIDGKPIKGRGTGDQVPNRFLKHSYGVVHWEGVDAVEEEHPATRHVVEHAKRIVNRVDAPDLRFNWSMNPYQGCEHGCAYCYARPTHEYWGYGAGLDFERVIIVKRNAPELLRATFMDRKWRPEPIMFSGNTDCYQPVERREGITRRMLEVLLEFRHPVSMITKNALVLRDLDILRELAAMGLVSVAISLTTLDEGLRRVMEPRTSTGINRLKAMEALTKAGVPVYAMVAPIIPALNEHEVPALIEAAANAGALGAGYTVVRTNGAVKPVFESWLRAHFPDRAEKVLAQVRDAHGGQSSDSRFGRRMRGEGHFAENIRQVVALMRRKHFAGRTVPELDRTRFKRPAAGQLELFG
ncbi:MAG: PA0069 family radical SAM protein [Flavobacteriales bacterium]|jgi:DNA repair photolyase|nr:PA0069 family radical SAM protein [Flavobacteriales bacterium]